MSKLANQTTFVVGVAVAMLCGILFGISLSVPEITPEWLFRYQTLITGILAVGAAAGTIVAMMRSDERADVRHDQVVGLNLRRDALLVNRSCNPSIPVLEKCEKDIHEFLQVFVNSNLRAKSFAQKQPGAIGDLTNVITAAKREIGAANVNVGLLLDADGKRKLDLAFEALSRLDRSIVAFTTGEPTEEESSGFFDMAFAAAVSLSVSRRWLEDFVNVYSRFIKL